jgi:hypothetical protein
MSNRNDGRPAEIGIHQVDDQLFCLRVYLGGDLIQDQDLGLPQDESADVY